MTQNFPNLAKELDIQEQKAQSPKQKELKQTHTPRHTIIRMTKNKDKERILKEARERQLVTCKGTPIRLSANFLTQTL